MKKHKKLIILFTCLIGLLVASYFVCSDVPYNMHYTVSTSTTKPNTLEVSLEITNSISSKGKKISLYSGDKTADLKYCIDQNGLNVPAQQIDNEIDFYLGRGEKITISYEAGIGSLGKHGLRGSISENYCTFDGGEAFLLPMEFYEADCPENKAVIGELSITMKMREGWIDAAPYTSIKNVTWADAYDLNNNSFCMGNFNLHKINSLNIYTLSQSSEKLSDSVQNGTLALYRYYADLFSFPQQKYSIILLPTSDESRSSIIGGAGTGSVCATFNANNKRDWELLSHRMFHAYFDSIFRTKEFHSAPRLWFYEGITTYYENRSMEFLPKEIQASLEIKPNQQFTSLFNKYLYVRLKDPSLFSFAPMDEEKITNSETHEAKIEFLHYIQAPLVIRLIEDISYQQSQKTDSLLKYLLKNKNRPDEYSYTKLLPQLLGKRGQEIYQNYFIANKILPLWYLQDSTYSQKQTLSDLNNIEHLLVSWMTAQPEKYPIEELSMNIVEKVDNRPEFKFAHFSDQQTEQSVQNYSVTIDSLLKEYALRADVCNVSLDDSELRSKLLLNEENKAKWKTWVEHIMSVS